MRVGVIGVGSIGSVLAQGLSKCGHDVFINDADPDAAAALPYPNRAKEWLGHECDVVVITVPTPTNEDGGDASAVDAVLTELPDDPDATVVIRSTMPPGETRALVDKHGLPLVYSPEFLRDRSTVADYFTVDRLVIAGPPDERETVKELFTDRRVDTGEIIEIGDYLLAELGKEAHNAYFATKVSFANQMRLICDDAGADAETVMDIVCADRRNTGSHLDPTLGPFGGKCLPKDTDALRLFAEAHDSPTVQLDATVAINQIAEAEFENVDTDTTSDEIETIADD